MIIKQARTKPEIEAVQDLFQEYEKSLNVDLCFQNFKEELAGLPGKYSYPDGDLLVAVVKEQIAGCVAVRRLSHGICEMKRLYVKPDHRGKGLGRRLAGEIIEISQKLGYSLMRLDTLDRLTEAVQLYESLGFKKTEPYCDNPLKGAVFLELELNRI